MFHRGSWLDSITLYEYQFKIQILPRRKQSLFTLTIYGYGDYGNIKWEKETLTNVKELGT
jgi:hypothetical protein